VSKKEARSRDVLEMVRLRRKVDVRTVAAAMAISEATVRRLFAELERQGLVIRVHGGVQLASARAYSFNQSVPQRVEHKLAIARAAVGHVREGDRVFLDSGTTVLKLAECMSIRLRDGSVRDLTVLTNSLGVAEMLADDCKVILIGGEVRLSRRDVFGALSEKMLQKFRVNRSFLGADGIDIDNGFMTTDEKTASMNEIVIERSEQALVLADSEKFHRSSFVAYAPLNSVDAVITDWELAPVAVQAFEAAGATLIVVDRPPAIVDAHGIE
jgi:DeoR/GlpR family transcriptional regulator of sugar metabolism